MFTFTLEPSTFGFSHPSRYKTSNLQDLLDLYPQNNDNEPSGLSEESGRSYIVENNETRSVTGSGSSDRSWAWLNSHNVVGKTAMNRP